ncbi:MAG TPA: hypothetical protein VGW77_08450 [Candidatus Binatia bacterium]|nr:hypothetical protein [Candidatus Binatia bacterium]
MKRPQKGQKYGRAISSTAYLVPCGYEECQEFFISEDHRVEYHPDCFKKKEAWWAKLNRGKEYE